ncbi:transposable element Tcb2 transposase [Trichonephila clavipes]|nr:transposable element Tcb2 transposase [Trichonephila clavipes]
MSLQPGKDHVRTEPMTRLTRIIKRDRRSTLPQIAAEFNAGPIKKCHRVNQSTKHHRYGLLEPKLIDVYGYGDNLLVTSMDPTCQQGTVQARGASVMVWGACSWRDMGSLIHLDTTLTGDKCEHSSEFILFLWPPKYPDINIIEYIWDALQRAVQKRCPSPLTPTDLWTALQDSWCQLPPALLQTLIESIVRRVAAFLGVRGRPTRY